MRGKAKASILVSAAFATLVAAAGLEAQPFEYAYGPGNTLDQAFRRVTPVAFCGGGVGYIAVGTSGIGTANSDVYVVRTNNAGVPIWEFTYDVQGVGAVDDGVALAEMRNGNGWVILANTQAGVWSPALIQIDCNGAVIWSRIYPDAAGLNLRGHDLIETVTGDPNFFTAAGDLAVAGLSFGGVANDAFLMRTNAAGFLIWNLAYDNTPVGGAPADEVFNALTEAAPLAGQLAGDLVAVGRYVSLANNNVQGLVARVNGNNGAVGGAPHCMAHHGGGAADTYQSVTQLQTAPFGGQFAMVGMTSNPPWLDDIWAVRGTPCLINSQSRIGDAGGVVTSEGALDVREVLVPLAVGVNVAVGDLAITGNQGPAVNGPWDAYLLFIRPGNLLPNFANLFGDHALRNEIGVSLSQIPAGGLQPPGFIIAGLTETDWDGLADPRDMYLVNTDNFSHTPCDALWQPVGFKPNWPSVNLAPNLRAPAQNFVLAPPAVQLQSPLPICP